MNTKRPKFFGIHFFFNKSGTYFATKQDAKTDPSSQYIYSNIMDNKYVYYIIHALHCTRYHDCAKLLVRRARQLVIGAGSGIINLSPRRKHKL